MTVFSSGLEQNINISDYLDNDIIVLEDYQTVSLQIVIENMVRKTIQINLGDIEFKGVAEGYAASFENSMQKAYITVFGISSVVNNLSSDMITAYVDCNGLKEGNYELPILTDLPSGCSQQAQTNVKVSVTILGSTNYGSDGVYSENNPADKPSQTPAADISPSEPAASPDKNEDNEEDEPAG